MPKTVLSVVQTVADGNIGRVNFWNSGQRNVILRPKLLKSAANESISQLILEEGQ